MFQVSRWQDDRGRQQGGPGLVHRREGPQDPSRGAVQVRGQRDRLQSRFQSFLPHKRTGSNYIFVLHGFVIV